MTHAFARSGDLPITARVLTQHLEQLRLTGLFLAFTGNLEQAITPIRVLYEVTRASLDAARDIGAVPSLAPMPVVCNVSNWRSDQLCGYAGLDLEVHPGELLASYVEHSPIALFPSVALPSLAP